MDGGGRSEQDTAPIRIQQPEFRQKESQMDRVRRIVEVSHIAHKLFLRVESIAEYQTHMLQLVANLDNIAPVADAINVAKWSEIVADAINGAKWSQIKECRHSLVKKIQTSTELLELLVSARHSALRLMISDEAVHYQIEMLEQLRIVAESARTSADSFEAESDTLQEQAEALMDDRSGARDYCEGDNNARNE